MQSMCSYNFQNGRRLLQSGHIEQKLKINWSSSFKMTHLVKTLAKNTSVLFQLSRCSPLTERCLPGVVTIRPHLDIANSSRENATDLVGEIQSGEKERGTQTKSAKNPKRKDFQPVKLNRNVLRKVRSVVGISVTPFTVGWAKIDLQEMRLVGYTGEDIGNENFDYSETLAYKKAKSISELIPESDLYIMERCPQFRRSSKEIQFKLMLSSMLAVLLHESTGPLGDEKVLFQNSIVIDLLYKLALDGERVSAGQVLQRTLGSTVAKQVDDGQYDICLSVDNVTLSGKRELVKSMFFSKPTIRDASAVAFFIAMSFIRSNPM